MKGENEAHILGQAAYDKVVRNGKDKDQGKVYENAEKAYEGAFTTWMNRHDPKKEKAVKYKSQHFPTLDDTQLCILQHAMGHFRGYLPFYNKPTKLERQLEKARLKLKEQVAYEIELRDL